VLSSSSEDFKTEEFLESLKDLEEDENTPEGVRGQ
jgi:hypothetical protein